MKKLSIEPTIHENVRMTDCRLGAWTEVGEQSYFDNVVLGDYSYTCPFGFFQNVIIGKFSNIAAQVRIGPTMHPMDRPTLHHFTYRRLAYGLDDHDDSEFFEWRRAQMSRVGHDTWIGHGAIIMPNVTIGDGAVIGSGAVVTKDIPAWGVAVGVPAKVIKQRFDDKTAEALTAIGWWDWTHEQLAERMQDFCGPVQAFIEKWGNHD